MFTLDIQMAFVNILIIPFLAWSVQIFRKKLHLTFYLIRQKVAQMNASVEENISGIRVAQSLAVEDRNIQDFSQISHQTYELRSKSTRLFAKMNAIVSMNSYIGLALMIGFGGYRFMSGGITLGIFLAFIQYTNQFLTPMNDLTNLTNTFMDAGAAILHIRKKQQSAIMLPEPTNPIAIPATLNGNLEFKDVSFQYTDVPLFQHLNFRFEAKEKIGIVGETGAGKTTLINLLTRLYDVKEGAVLIDGIDIRSISQKDLRSVMGIISQNVFLFSDSIMNNIRFGKPSASDEEVKIAARCARADLFIEKMPNSYETKMGESGNGLSGGQKQLIAYARLILAQPKIAILDEATSNIDSYTENLIQKNMEQTLNNTTMIIIAHRFATLQRVQRIFVLRNGKIEAIGSHTELMQKNLYYRELCEKQYSKL
jgi:ABC-type multidrug transport system fused ATPase/permease subunit